MDVFGPGYGDPTSEEFRRRKAAVATRLDAPDYSSAMTGGEQGAFGALRSSNAAGEQQADLARALKAQMEGRAPSLAGMQYAQALEQSQAAAQSQLASARGLSPAQAQRMMLMNQAGARANLATQSAQLRLQEQQAAQAALGNVLQSQRQADVAGGSLAAGMYSNAGQMGLQKATTQANLDQAATGIVMNQAAAERQANQQFVSGLIQGGASLGAAAATGGKGGAVKSARGGLIPGKAARAGDHEDNDTVPALLSPGEIVVPRSIVQAEDAPERAAAFVEAIKKTKKSGGPKTYGETLMRLREVEARIAALEADSAVEGE